MQIHLEVLNLWRSGPGRFFFPALMACLVLASGCARRVPGPGERWQTARDIAATVPGAEEIKFAGLPFDLLGFTRIAKGCRDQEIHIYIEGDGLAWLTPSIVSKDPTPLSPLALRLWANDPHPFKIYLARPCQYVSGAGCNKTVWTAGRFSEDVIQTYHRVLDQISRQLAPASFTLFGYSGGGAVAAILSARRTDISRLVTVAGNLDTAFWTRKHRLSPLAGSLNPADFAKELEHTDQYHFIGGLDKTVGPDVFFSFVQKFADRTKLHYTVQEQFNHGCCWEDAWPVLLKQIKE